MRRLKIDWEELEEAFSDVAREHRYYLDCETGEVHFFSAYLDNEDEREDERRMSGETRYVPIPLLKRLVPLRDVHRFVGTLSHGPTRSALATSLEGKEDFDRFASALDGLPRVQDEWSRFRKDLVRQRVQEWLSEVGVQPID